MPETMSERYIVGRVSDIDCRDRDPWRPEPAPLDREMYSAVAKLANRIAVLEREVADMRRDMDIGSPLRYRPRLTGCNCYNTENSEND